jgi:hypothetical protein
MVSIAYRNTTYIANQVFPIVGVENQSDKYYIFDKGAWFRIADRARRAPGVRAARIDYSLSTGSYLCIEYSLAKGVPDETRKNADNPLNPETEAVQFTTDALLRLQEDRVATLVLTNGSTNWANVATPSTKWDDDTSDPVGDVETGRTTVAKTIGVLPNTLVMGFDVWSALKQHPDLLDRIKYTERGILTPDIAAGIFEVENILVGTAVKEKALEGATGSMAYIWGEEAALIYVPANPGLMTPAAGYTFSWLPFAAERYREDQEKQDVFAVAHSVDERITGSDAGYCLYNCLS